MSEEQSRQVLSISSYLFTIRRGNICYLEKRKEDLSHKKSKVSADLIKKLQKENEALKLLLAEKELESKLKDDLLKNNIPNGKENASTGIYVY